MPKRIEAGIGQPTDDLLPGIGKPGTPTTRRTNTEQMRVGYFRPDSVNDPMLTVRIRIITEDDPITGAIISSFRGNKNTGEYAPGDIVEVPETAKFVHEGFWPIRKSRDDSKKIWS